MTSLRPLALLALLALAACADDPTGAPPPAPAAPAPQVLGVYEITLTGAGTPDVRASAAPVPGGPGFALSPASTLGLEVVSSSSFTEGARGQGGQRYINVTYRVRNATGAQRRNVTMVPVTRSTTLPGTPFSSLVLFNGTAADPSLASQFVPTGAVTLGGGAGMRATEVDVLQVFQESEVAAVTPPAGVTGLFPYGFVVRSATDPASRTLPVAASANDWGGLVTFAYRYPLTASANSDPFLISFQVLALEDTETRMTESMEEAQDTSAARRVWERAAALGATTVTVLPGSPAASLVVPDYPGQRQICSVRTAGTPAAPVRFINAPAAYTVLNLLRSGEAASACGAYFRTGAPATPSPGTAAPFTLVAMDRYGNVRASEVDSVQLERVSGPAAAFGPRVALAGGQADVPATYGGPGTSLLRAAGRRVRAEHAVDVGAPSVTVNDGRWQAAMAGTAVPTPPSVKVRDAAGNPLAGRRVQFAAATGGGAVTGAVATTDARGIATAGSWTLGATADLNTLTATVAGAGVTSSPVTFRAAGCADGGATGYGITLCFTSTLSPAHRTAFQAAAARWQAIVRGDLPAVPVDQTPGFCGSASPGLRMSVDDLLLFVGVEPIDGEYGTAGNTGPCWVRDDGLLPFVGMLRYDVADMPLLELFGSFSALVMHDMGHALGVGLLWRSFGLVQNPSQTTTLDTYYTGAGGRTGFDNVGGAAYTGGQKVPVENTARDGTQNTHWRESVLGDELMTGVLGGGSNPISEVTVRSLADLGYTVDVAAADPFFLTLALRADGAGARPGLDRRNEVRPGPLRRMDARGRVVPDP